MIEYIEAMQRFKFSKRKILAFVRLKALNGRQMLRKIYYHRFVYVI